MAVHTIEGGSGEAYDQSQYRGDIAMGDVLVSPDDRVVGILVGAWPTAVTTERGSFHGVTKPWTELAQHWMEQDGLDYVTALSDARKICDERGWPWTEQHV